MMDGKLEALKFNRQCDRHNFVTGGMNDWNSLPTNINVCMYVYLHLYVLVCICMCMNVYYIVRVCMYACIL